MTSSVSKLSQFDNHAVSALTFDASVNIYNRLKISDLKNIERTCSNIAQYIKEHPLITTTVAQNEFNAECESIPRLVASLPIDNQDSHLEWTISIAFKHDLELAVDLLRKTTSSRQNGNAYPLPDWAYFMAAMLKNRHASPENSKRIIVLCYNLLCEHNQDFAQHVLFGELVTACIFFPLETRFKALMDVLKKLPSLHFNCKLIALMAFAQLCPKLLPQLKPEEVSALLKEALPLTNGVETVVDFDANPFDLIARDNRLNLFEGKQGVTTVQGELIRACSFLPADHRLVLLEHAFNVVNNIQDVEYKILTLEALVATSSTLGTKGFLPLKRTVDVLGRFEFRNVNSRGMVYGKIIAACPSLEPEQALTLLERIFNSEEQSSEILSGVLWGLSLLEPKSIDRLLNRIIEHARGLLEGDLLAKASVLVARLDKDQGATLIQKGIDFLSKSPRSDDDKLSSICQIAEALSLLDPNTAYHFLSQITSLVAPLYYVAKTCVPFNEPRFHALFRKILIHLENPLDLSDFHDFVCAIQSSEHRAIYLQILLERLAQMHPFARLPLLLEITQTSTFSEQAAEMLQDILCDLKPFAVKSDELDDDIDVPPFRTLLKAISDFSIPRDKKEGARLLREAIKLAPEMEDPSFHTYCLELITEACPLLESSDSFEILSKILDEAISYKLSLSLLLAVITASKSLPFLRRILESIKNQPYSEEILQRLANATPHLGPVNGPILLEDLYQVVRISGADPKSKTATLNAIIGNYLPYNPERALEILLENSEDKRLLKNLGQLPPDFWTDPLKILKTYKEWGAPQESFERLAFLIGSLQRFQLPGE